MSADKILYTYTDEAPMLATYSLLPIIQTFTKACGVPVEIRDISVAGRVISQFPSETNKKAAAALSISTDDYLAELGELCKAGKANVIKLPNISASLPQLEACIEELRGKGFDLPNYEDAKEKYGKVIGSAVNPVLREGNSDRRVAKAVKQYAQKYPKKLGKWSKDCKSHVSHMEDGDFYGSEKSVTVEEDMELKIELVENDSVVKTLKEGIKVGKDDVMDCSRMSCAHLRGFFDKQIEECAGLKDGETGNDRMLLSLHLKATMMKVSDPILFGHCVEVYYKDVWEKYGALFKELGISSRNGVGDVYAKLKGHEKQAEVEAALKAVYSQPNRPPLAMVDSDRGITNLHVPSDVIIDASMPVVVRDSGKMWCPDSAEGARDSSLKEVKCLIPDRSYAGMYKASLDYCREHGEFDPSTMGNVSNVGLMAQKAEEYGSHDKTFEVPAPGVDGAVSSIRVVDVKSGKTVLEQTNLGTGDVFRSCLTKDVAIKDWVRLTVERSKLSGSPAIFWLDPNRAHDREMIKKVDLYLPTHDTTGLSISTKDPISAINESMARCSKGEDTISATGNVLRDYLTDLFPIIELGTSAKMLSIVPLLAGGSMFETGAGGSAPKHVQQFTKENHLRWDSLGEFLALAESLDYLGDKGSKNAKILAQACHKANAEFLVNEECQVSRKAGEIDNRGSHFFWALYWARALSQQTEDTGLQALFKDFLAAIEASKDEILKFLNECQKVSVDLGGYYRVDDKKTEAAMRPCAKWNELLESWGKKMEEAAGVAAPAASAEPAVVPEDVQLKEAAPVKSPKKGLCCASG